MTDRTGIAIGGIACTVGGAAFWMAGLMLLAQACVVSFVAALAVHVLTNPRKG